MLLVDAFDAERMPEMLGTRRFYDDCADVLRPGGLAVVNLHAAHPHLPPTSTDSAPRWAGLQARCCASTTAMAATAS